MLAKTKGLITILIVVVSSIGLFGQDKIYLNSGESLDAKVLEILPTEVTYKKWSNIEGPVYHINKSEITIIVYENGDSDNFNVGRQVEVGPFTTVKSKSNNTVKSRSEKSHNRFNLAVFGVEAGLIFLPMISYENIKGGKGLEFAYDGRSLWFSGGTEYLTVNRFGIGNNWYSKEEGKGIYGGLHTNFAIIDYTDYRNNIEIQNIPALDLGFRGGVQIGLTKRLGMNFRGIIGGLISQSYVGLYYDLQAIVNLTF